MALTPGSRIGPYEITALIGEGGMGQVYRARDTKLGRDVAIKALPAAVAQDPDRLARFDREARTLASLNHPHIAAIYGIEESSDTTALVMELVEGPTLADRLVQGAIGSDEALAIARQIAEALEAAHDQGIVHRDLKPANLKVRDDGTVKVLDFGLAKALGPAENERFVPSVVSLSPTITTPAMTQMGMILGTAAYMSPEQARGKPVDRRADIWAFGCVLYEMLTGRRAFDADDVSLTLARVLERDVDLDALPTNVPLRVRQTLRVCLRKDPKQRASDIRDVRLALDGAFDSTAPAPAFSGTHASKALWRRMVPVAAALAIGLIGGAMVSRIAPVPAATAPAVTQFEIDLGQGQGFTSAGRQMLDISDDGSRIVYVADRRLNVRSMADLEARPVPGTEGFANVGHPVVSPDGEWVAFWATSGTTAVGTIRKIPIAGGTSVTLCQATSPTGLTWAGDSIVYGQGGQGIFRISANGGQPERLVVGRPGEEGTSNPEILPDQRTMLFAMMDLTSPTGGVNARLMAQSLVTGESKVIVRDATDARYLDSGHLVYTSGGVVYAAPFDVERLAIVGTARPVLEGVRTASGRPHYAVSRNGTLVYAPGPSIGLLPQWKVARIDRKGAVEAFPIDASTFNVVRISPNGQMLALGSEDDKEAVIWIYDIASSGAPRRLTFDGRNRFPVWSHDSQYVAFQSDREGDLAIYRQRADNSGIAERLTKADKGTTHFPESWSSDGLHLLYDLVDDETAALWSLTIADKRAAVVGNISSPKATLHGAALSPDGRWVAYASREGRTSSAIYVEPFPPTGAKHMVSKNQDDGHHPVWSPTGMELFFTPGSGTRVSVVRVTTRPAFSIMSDERILPRPFRNAAPLAVRPFDVAPDGEHFIGLVDPAAVSAGAAADRLRVVLNWVDDLKRRVPIP